MWFSYSGYHPGTVGPPSRELPRGKKKCPTTKFWKRARAIRNYTRVTTLHSCYMGMPTFSANQRRAIFFFLTLSILITYLCINACRKNRATAISTVIAFIYVVTKLEVKNSKRINAKLSAVVNWRISLFECLSVYKPCRSGIKFAKNGKLPLPVWCVQQSPCRYPR